MKRRHWFEFNEALWAPAWLKALVTDYLSALTELTQPFSPQLPLILQGMQHSRGKTNIVDLCSGGGGPWRHLAPQLNRLAGRSISVVLTDKHPSNHAASLADQMPGVRWCADSVDAMAVAETMPGVRTLFNGFHHFRPQAATAILRDAVGRQESIVIMEMLQRGYKDLFITLLTPLIVLCLTPWIRPFSWSRIVLTYLVPVAPLVIFWDTLVSVLRCYTPHELRQMTRQADEATYEWFADKYRYHGVSVTFLIGHPRTNKAHDIAA